MTTNPTHVAKRQADRRATLALPRAARALLVERMIEIQALNERVFREAHAAAGFLESLQPPSAPWDGVTERRATFACTPGLQRPLARIAPGLLAAGDYIEGPYPATLEGSVRSGLHAAQAIG